MSSMGGRTEIDAVGRGRLFLGHVARTVAESRIASELLVFVFIWLVAAAAFSGYIGKWGLRDGDPQHGIEYIIDGTAHRPFVYRQLAPMIANGLNDVVPDSWKAQIERHVEPQLTFAKVTSISDPQMRFRYIVVYLTTFLAFLASLFVLRSIVLETGGSRFSALLAVTSFALAFPYLQTVGGYFYDVIELLFLSLAFLFALRQRCLMLLLLTIPATLNKESFLFFLPGLFPLLQEKLHWKKAGIFVGAALLIAALVNLVVKHEFAANPGEAIEIHFFRNIHLYLTPWPYRQVFRESTYGLIGPSYMFIGTLFVIFVIAYRGWRDCSDAIKKHLMLLTVINAALLLLFCEVGELRNLSLLFVGLVIMIANVIDRASLAREQIAGPRGNAEKDGNTITRV